MTIREVQNLLDAKVVCGEDKLGLEVDSAFGSDMMSDVLAFAHQKVLLLTGLVNQHVLRTAEMLDMGCIVFVRGKNATEDLIETALEQNLIILATEKTLYESCGILYASGLPACGK